MVKNSFTLIETLISITLLLIVISGFINSTYNDSTSEKNFVLLNNLQNNFDTKNYTNFEKSTENITIIKNKSFKEFISISKYQFENENIKIFKYEK